MPRLTVKAIEALSSGPTRREIPDALMQGLYLVVQPTGSKSWAVRCRQNGRPRKFTVGRYPLYGLTEAREAAAGILRSVSEGRDPARPNSGSVDDVVAQFFDRYGRRHYRPKTLTECTRVLNRAVAEWRGRKLDSITRADVRALLDGIEGPAAGNQAYKFTKRFFNWATEQDLLAASPLAGLKKPHKDKSRERVLTDDELRRVWLAAEKIGYPFGALVKLLVLTGQRRGEVSGMRRDELQADTWILPGSRVKNGKLHSVPLARQALAIIESQPHVSDRYVFSYGTRPLGGFHRAKGALDELVGVTDWTLHDLRRTAASGMARLGVSLVVIEKILNHVSGSLAGIVGVYQRHEFADEKRAALQRWADHVEQLVDKRRTPLSGQA